MRVRAGVQGEEGRGGLYVSESQIDSVKFVGTRPGEQTKEQ